MVRQMSKLRLKPNPTLADFQRYIDDMVAERGFADETVAQSFMLLIEEVGEFAKAARKSEGVKLAVDAQKQQLEHEAADVFILLLCLCNKLGVDLEQAFRAKEEYNKQRVWK